MATPSLLCPVLTMCTIFYMSVILILYMVVIPDMISHKIDKAIKHHLIDAHELYQMPTAAPPPPDNNDGDSSFSCSDLESCDLPIPNTLSFCDPIEYCTHLYPTIECAEIVCIKDNNNTNVCLWKPLSVVAPCNDNDPYTVNDTCTTFGTCKGQYDERFPLFDCSATEAASCMKDNSCQHLTACIKNPDDSISCVWEDNPDSEDAVCDDQNPFTETDRCNGDGICKGIPIRVYEPCNDPEFCPPMDNPTCSNTICLKEGNEQMCVEHFLNGDSCGIEQVCSNGACVASP